jgi:hypothetical protein
MRPQPNTPARSRVSICSLGAEGESKPSSATRELMLIAHHAGGAEGDPQDSDQIGAKVHPATA